MSDSDPTTRIKIAPKERPSVEPPAVTRARSAIGRLIRYRLGAGGRDPSGPSPSSKGFCDCSGFVAWCLGVDRHQPGRISGDWISTSSIVREARRGAVFEAASTPRPGDVVVYGDYTTEGKRRQGHCGIVVAVPEDLDDLWARIRVVHCSASNSRRGDAIAETDGAAFAARGIFARFLGLTVG